MSIINWGCDIVSNDERGWIRKLVCNDNPEQIIWLSFTRKGYARGGDIHDGRQFNTVIKGDFLIKLKFSDNDESKNSFRIWTGKSIIIPKDIAHVFIALEDTLMIEWHDHELPPYEKKRFYEPYRKLCKEKNNV